MFHPHNVLVMEKSYLMEGRERDEMENKILLFIEDFSFLSICMYMIMFNAIINIWDRYKVHLHSYKTMPKLSQ